MVLTKRRNTVRIIADEIRSTVALGNSTFHIFRAGSIDGGVASGAIDGNSDILRRAVAILNIAAANRRSRFFTGNGVDRAAGDGDIGLAGNKGTIIIVESSSDGCRTIVANGGHIGVLRNRDRGMIAIRVRRTTAHLAGTDAGTTATPFRKDGGIAGNAHFTTAANTTANTGSVCRSVGMHIGVVFDLDVLSGSVLATADSGSIITKSGNFGITGDGDVGAISVLTTTDSGGTIATIGIYLGIAGDGDVGAITGSIAIGTAAANTSTGPRMIIRIASLGSIACTDISAGDGDVGSTVPFCSVGDRGLFPTIQCALSADAGTALTTAYYSQRTGIAAGRIAVLVFLFFRAIVILIVRDGQGAGAFSIGLFQTGVGTGAGQRVVPVQLNVGFAVALHGQRSLGITAPCALPVDKHILQGHIGGLIFCRLHRDGI